MIERELNRKALLENRIRRLDKTIEYITSLEKEPGLILGELRQMEPMMDVIKKYKIKNDNEVQEILESLITKIDASNVKDVNRLQDILNTNTSVEELKLVFINLTKSYKENVEFVKKYFENNPLGSQDYLEMRNSLFYGEYEMLMESLEGVKLIKTPEGQIRVDNREYLRLRKISDETLKKLRSEPEQPEEPEQQKKQRINLKIFTLF